MKPVLREVNIDEEDLREEGAGTAGARDMPGEIPNLGRLLAEDGAC
jgi:hypothetical protein